MKENKKIPVVFLVGQGHSGSTIMDLIFDTHSQIVGVGELCQYFVFREKDHCCTCGQKLAKCKFWQNVFANIPEQPSLRITRSKIDFLLDRKKYFYCCGKERIPVDLEEFLKRQEQIYRNILFYSGKKIIFDSSKNPHLAEAFLSSNKLEIILLHLVRDGRGVVYSYKKAHPERSLFSVMWEWAATNLKIEIIKKRYPCKYIFVRYEDFSRTPELIIKRILSEIKLNYEPEMLNFHKKVHHQAGGNINVRFPKKKSNQIKEDIAWKTKLPLLDKIIFNLLFGWLNLYYQKIK